LKCTSKIMQQWYSRTLKRTWILIIT